MEEQIDASNREFAQFAEKEDGCRRLLTIPGVDPLTATALIAAIGNGAAFRKSRDLAAWLGLVPKQHSTGGKTRLLGGSANEAILTFVDCLFMEESLKKRGVADLILLPGAGQLEIRLRGEVGLRNPLSCLDTSV